MIIILNVKGIKEGQGIDLVKHKINKSTLPSQKELTYLLVKIWMRILYQKMKGKVF